jgi:hypothetical protein
MSFVRGDVTKNANNCAVKTRITIKKHAQRGEALKESLANIHNL